MVRTVEVPTITYEYYCEGCERQFGNERIAEDHEKDHAVINAHPVGKIIEYKKYHEGRLNKEVLIGVIINHDHKEILPRFLVEAENQERVWVYPRRIEIQVWGGVSENT